MHRQVDRPRWLGHGFLCRAAVDSHLRPCGEKRRRPADSTVLAGAGKLGHGVGGANPARPLRSGVAEGDATAGSESALRGVGGGNRLSRSAVFVWLSR